MTPSGYAWHDDPRIDRLIDGEIQPDDLRRLVGELDRDPEGWRALALALLESQAWTRELLPVAAEGAAEPPRPAPKTPRARAARLASWKTESLVRGAMGVALVATLVLAVQLFPWRNPEGPLDQGGRLAATRGGGRVVPSDPTMREATAPLLPMYPFEIPGSVRLSVEDVTPNDPARPAKPLVVPVVAMDQEMRNQVIEQVDEVGVPDELVQLARGTRSTVRRVQFWTRVRLTDGRQVIVPVEHVELTPARVAIP